MSEWLGRNARASLARAFSRNALKSPTAGALWDPSVQKHPRHVAHFAAGANRSLAIEVDRGSRQDQPAAVIFHLVADKVRHLDAAVAQRFSQRPAGDRSDVLLELRHRSAVDRPMAGIVNPRCDLVDDKAAVAEHEHLDRKHADIVKLMRDGFGD